MESTPWYWKRSDGGRLFRLIPTKIFFGPWLNNLLPGSSIDWAWLLKRSTQPAYSKYLQDYAHQNRLPVKCGVAVQSVVREEDGFRIQTSAGQYRCHLLVNCTGYFTRPYTPNYPGLDTTRISDMHVSQYRDPATVDARAQAPQWPYPGGGQAPFGRRDLRGTAQRGLSNGP